MSGFRVVPKDLADGELSDVVTVMVESTYADIVDLHIVSSLNAKKDWWRARAAKAKSRRASV